MYPEQRDRAPAPLVADRITLTSTLAVGGDADLRARGILLAIQAENVREITFTGAWDRDIFSRIIAGCPALGRANFDAFGIA